MLFLSAGCGATLGAGFVFFFSILDERQNAYNYIKFCFQSFQDFSRAGFNVRMLFFFCRLRRKTEIKYVDRKFSCKITIRSKEIEINVLHLSF